MLFGFLLHITNLLSDLLKVGLVVGILRLQLLFNPYQQSYLITSMPNAG